MPTWSSQAVGSITLTYTATDPTGQTKDQTITVTTTDTVLPTATGISIDSATQFTITFSEAIKDVPTANMVVYPDGEDPDLEGIETTAISVSNGKAVGTVAAAHGFDANGTYHFQFLAGFKDVNGNELLHTAIDTSDNSIQATAPASFS